MARIDPYVELQYGDITIGHDFRSGIIPNNQPLPNGLFLNYSTDDRSMKNFRVMNIRPNSWVPGATPARKFEIKNLDFNDTAQRNAYCMYMGKEIGGNIQNFYSLTSNMGVSYRGSISPNITPYWYIQNSSEDANWITSGAPVWQMYAYFNPITNFKYNKIALYAYVVCQGSTSDGYYTEWGGMNYGIYDYFIDENRPETPSGVTFNGISIRYTIPANYMSDGSGSDTSNTNRAFCLGKILNIPKTTVKGWSNSAETATSDFEIEQSYLFPLSSNILLGSSSSLGSGKFGNFQSFVGHSRYIYLVDNTTTDNDYEEKNKVFMTTQGIGYEDALASALSKGLGVIDKYSTYTNFRANTWDNFVSNFLDDHLIYPIIDGNKVTNDFKKGNEIFDTEQYKKWVTEDKNPFEETSEFDPDDPDDVDPNDYTDTMPLNEVPSFMNPIGKFNRYYALSSLDIGDLAAFLSPSADNVWDDILNGLKLYGENPMNFLLNLMAFPFDITTYTGQQQEEITFGRRINTGIMADKITDASIVISLGKCYFRRYYKNFLDYEPYCTAKLYIPYCGEVSIPTSVFLGHTIEVKMIIDLSTGGCEAVIYKDGIAALYSKGTIGVPIPMTGMDSSQYVDAMWNMISGATNSVMQIASSGAQLGKTSFTETTGASMANTNSRTFSDSKSFGETKTKQLNAPGIAGGFISGLQTAYEFNNIPTPLETQGTAIPYANFFKPQRCYFIVQQAIPMNINGYGEKIGYACMENRKITTEDNYILAQNPKVQPPNATKQETDEINMLLSTGVWV